MSRENPSLCQTLKTEYQTLQELQQEFNLERVITKNKKLSKIYTIQKNMM